MKKLIYLFAFLLMPLVVFGQSVTISGNIQDDLDFLSGVTVVEKGTSNGTITDFNGNFDITVSSQNSILVVSYIGYGSQEIELNNQTRVSIQLEQSSESLDEVVVQGFSGVIGKSRKRIASIQSTPESVTAFNSQGIEKSGISNITSFADLVPNLKLSESQAVGVNSLVVRGIPQIRNTDAPVAFVIDGVTIADPSLLNQELFDLALIEVVKGPQGALYGKNAIGGAINIYSKEPTNKFSNNVTLGLGNGNAQVARFISSGAIKKDKVFYRFSSQYKSFDGLLTNEFLDEKVDFRKEMNLRGQLMFRLNPNLKANATLQYLNNEGGATYYSVNSGYVDNDFFLTYLDPNPKGGNNVISQDVLGNSDMKNMTGSLNVEYDMNNIKVQSITSFSNVDRSTTGDLDFTELDVANFGLDQGETNNTRTFNQEIRISNRDTSSKFDWSVGGFVQNLEREFFQSDLFFSDDWAVRDDLVEFNTLAMFGFFDYKISDKLTASFGLRYDRDKITLDDRLGDTKADKEDNVLQPKASLSYKKNENFLYYFNYGRGYRAGGYNPMVTVLFDRDFEKELSDNYELGFKTSSWNDRFILNGSVFFSSFTNRQQFAITSDFFIPGNFNYDKSEISGFEIETKTRLSKYLDVLFNYGYVKSTITAGGATGGSSGDLVDLDAFIGKNTSLVPQNNFNFGLASSIPLKGSVLDLNLNYNGTGKIYWEDSNDPRYTSSAYELLDIKATLTINNLSISIWGKNILDTQYYLDYTLIDNSAFGYETGSIGWRGTPAQVGTTISFKF